MNPFLAITLKTENILSKLNKSLLRKADAQYKVVERWYKDDPHSLKRSTFNFLNEDSIVFDLGGYEGQWSSDIYARYKSKILIFEPIKSYADLIADRFKPNKDIKVYQFGLGIGDSEIDITIDAFASSVITQNNNRKKEKIQIKDFLAFLNENRIKSIDLIKINIEGSEFDLLEYLIQHDYLKKITGLLIQFHRFAPNAISRMENIKSNMKNTHECIFSYEFVWEFWQLKSTT
jgi:FkbM family methyltransferase